jgi:hypothetical protein
MDAKALVKALVDYDNNRARSKQTAIGVSQLGGCRRQVWHKLQGAEETNTTLRLPAIMGTAIHAAIEKISLGENALIEHRVEIEGLPPATIDYFDTATGEVVDWKTITLKSRDYFVTKQKRWQVQTYGYLMEQAGYEVKTVTLVGIPRDGNENDILVHSEPYDRTIGVEALNWLEEVKAATEAPAPERDAVSFCQNYCPFYGSVCNGIPKDMSGEAITDDTATRAAKRYVELAGEIKSLESEKENLKSALEGVAGVTFDGIKVSWSQIAGRETPDTEEIVKLLGSVPTKKGAPSLRLTVK